MDRSRAQPYPIALTQLNHLLCIVVGGGEVATRKVGGLLESGAHVKVISPELHPDLIKWREDGRIVHVARAYQPGDLRTAFLVIAATDRPQVNAAVAEEARQRGVLHNIADDPDAGNFHTVGAVRRGDVLLTVSTGGASPALAALIRRKLDATFGPEYAVLAERLSAIRRELDDTLPAAARTRLWRALASDDVLAMIRAGDEQALEAHIRQVVADVAESHGRSRQ